jgi:hypothetical protein
MGKVGVAYGKTGNIFLFLQQTSHVDFTGKTSPMLVMEPGAAPTKYECHTPSTTQQKTTRKLR